MSLRRGFLTAAVCLLAAAPATAAPPSWAPASSATIHPGVQMFTDGGQCTANFVFYDRTDVYIGFAAHCAEDSDAAVGTANSDCTSKSFKIGTRVKIDGASEPGTLAYSSYATMLEKAEDRTNVCRYNDFAVVRINPADVGKVNPSMPFWGGPTGLRQSSMATFEKVVSFGNSGLRAGIEQLSPKEGYTLGENSEGMSHHLYTATPGIFGDSGSGYLDGSGSAFGIASTISALTTNNASDVAFAMDYMHKHSALRLWLALGTEKFRGPLAGPGIAPSPPPEQQPDPDPQPAPGDPAPGGGGGEPAPGGSGGGSQPSGSGGSGSSQPSGSGSGGSNPPKAPPPAAGSREPTVSISKPPASRRKLKKFFGRSFGAATIEVSIVAKSGKRCFTLAPSRRFIRGCVGNWILARGASKWSLSFRSPAPKGTYTIRVRALDSLGRLLAQSRRTVRPK